MLYNDTILEHVMNPKNAGALADANGVGEIGDGRCDDVMKIYVRVQADVIIEASFETFGCAGSIAACSAATELLRGRTVAQAKAITAEEIDQALEGLPEEKRHCAETAAEASQAALADYEATREI